jgi:hypothetical protein
MKTKPVAEFIRAKGGTAHVAAALDVSPGAVRMWRQRNQLPRARWPEMVERLETSLDELKAIEQAA